MVVLLVAGIGLLLAGLLAIGYGIPINEFGFGNTLIVAGTVSACTGIAMVGLWAAVRELKKVARALGPGIPADVTLMAATAGVAPRIPALATESAGDAVTAPPSPAPWHEETASRDRERSEGPAATESAEAAPALKPRRNLLFSSSSRKERERAQARTAEPSMDPGSAAAAAPPAAGPSEPPPASFEEAWPKPERARTADAPPLPRRDRAPSTFAEAGAGAAAGNRHPPAAASPSEEQPAITVLKSGVVDGMAYSLYSDGSIEAQMPEGMMRFASIDELRTHLDQRP